MVQLLKEVQTNSAAKERVTASKLVGQPTYNEPGRFRIKSGPKFGARLRIVK